jgi:hypothetical protein
MNVTDCAQCRAHFDELWESARLPSARALVKSMSSCSFLLYALLLLSPVVAQSPPTTLQEPGLRSLVLESPAPTYDGLAPTREGVSVLNLLLSDSGTVESITILEAPDDAARDALIRALHHWRFKPMGSGNRLIRVAGKLTFYHYRDHGQWTIQSPSRHTHRRFIQQKPRRAFLRTLQRTMFARRCKPQSLLVRAC